MWKSSSSNWNWKCAVSLTLYAYQHHGWLEMKWQLLSTLWVRAHIHSFFLVFLLCLYAFDFHSVETQKWRKRFEREMEKERAREKTIITQTTNDNTLWKKPGSHGWRKKIHSNGWNVQTYHCSNDWVDFVFSSPSSPMFVYTDLHNFFRIDLPSALPRWQCVCFLHFVRLCDDTHYACKLMTSLSNFELSRCIERIRAEWGTGAIVAILIACSTYV